MTYNTLTTPLRRCPDLQKVRKSRNYSSLRPRETCANCLFRCLSPYLVRSIRIDVQSHTSICASQNVYMYRPKRLYVSPCPIGGTTRAHAKESFFEDFSCFSLSIQRKALPLRRLNQECACGGIGRHARLRIWCREACRFESYQAYEAKAFGVRHLNGSA